MEWTPHWSLRASSDTVSCTFSYHTWQFIIFTIFTITACIFSYSLSVSFWTQDLALQQILSSIDLFLYYRTDYTDSRNVFTLLNGCTGLSRLVAFECTALSCHFISLQSPRICIRPSEVHRIYRGTVYPPDPQPTSHLPFICRRHPSNPVNNDGTRRTNSWSSAAVRCRDDSVVHIRQNLSGSGHVPIFRSWQPCSGGHWQLRIMSFKA